MKQDRYALVLSILAVVAGLGSRASATVAVRWESFYDSPFHGTDTAIGVVVDHDDNIIVIGSIESIPGVAYSTDIATVKYGPSGDTIWARHGVFAPRFPAWAQDIAVDDQNNIYVTGTSGDVATTVGVVTVKYRPNGDTAWVRTENPVSYWYALGKRVQVDAQENVYAAGITRRPEPFPGSGDTLDFLLTKYDSSGNRLWRRFADGPSDSSFDALSAMCLDPAGNVILVGRTGDPTRRSSTDFLTVKFSPAGDTLWCRTFDCGDNEDDYPVAVTADGAGNVYVCGASFHNTTYWDYQVVKYSPAGDTLLTAWYNNDLTDGSDIPSAIAVDQSQNIYVTGTSNDTLDGYPADSACFATVKFSPAGGLPVWRQKYRGIHSAYQSFATALKLDRYGNVYVTGTSDNDVLGDLQQATLKYDSRGNLKWEVRVGGEESDAHARALALDSKGNVYVAGDDYVATDSIPGWDYTLTRYSGPDVGVTRVIAPHDTIRVNHAVTPTIMVKNYSPFPLTDVPVYMFIGPTWFNTTVGSLPANDSQVVSFESWSSRDAGDFPIRAYTVLSDDWENANDTAYGFVSTVLPWVAKDTIPIGPKKKYVKDGAGLAYDDDLNTIYAVKGNNTPDFFSFGSGQTWVKRDSVPVGAGRRKVKKGAAMVCAGNNTVYLAKGNRTAEFWAYNPATSWAPKPNLPYVLKSGTAMAYVPDLGRIYVLPAENTRQFWYYDTAGTWHNGELPDMPNGPKNKTCKDGTSLAYDGSQYLYALKGKTSEFYAYDVMSNVWYTRDILPNSQQTGKKKTSGDGAAFAFAGGLLYALKGNNTREFWCWSPVADTWTEKDSMLGGLKKKRVKAGGSLVSVRGKVYAFKGNGTNEFYMYNANISSFLGSPVQPGSQTSALDPAIPYSLRVAPNPFRGSSVVTYSLPRPGAVSVKLYDVTGRMEIDLYAGRQRAGNYRLSLANPQLAAGVYFLKMRFDDGTNQQQLTTKVLVER
jgi:hypothetical protein